MSFLLSPMRRTTTTLPTFAHRSFSTSRPAQLARMTLVGRLGNDPELIDTSKGSQLVRYVIGTDSGPRDNRNTSWFRVTSFADGPQREYLLNLTKGTLVYLEGDASLRSYDDAEGKKQSSLSIVQTRLDVLKRNQPREEGGSA